ncbi:MAG: hypothetical protein IT340_12565 [Chloroflexi bacterium]|nr:hypothetical protein [Chloroflexota bacterium]
MSTTLQDIIALHYQGGGSDKLWAAALIARDGGTDLITLWGRRGAALQSRIDAGPNAARIFAKKRDEKLREGYVAMPADRPEDGILVTLHGLTPELVGLADLTVGLVAPAPAERGPIASRVGVVPAALVEAYLADAGWGLTEKVNGERCLVRVAAGTLQAFNRRGQPQPGRPAGVERLVGLADQLVLDGERLAGVYALFDLLALDGESLRDRPYAERIALLAERLLAGGLLARGAPTLAAARDGARVPDLALLAPAVTADAKRTTYAALAAAGAEGVIFRQVAGPSREGPNPSPHEGKVKFVAELDAIVIGVRRGAAAGSLRLGLVRPADGAVIEVGTVRSGLTDDDVAAIAALVQAGQRPVLTITYLPARTVGLTLVEPTTSRRALRSDKAAADCTTEQVLDVLGEDRAALIAGASPVTG